MDVVDSVLSHYGRKGMKWGVRKSASSGPTDVMVRAVPGKKLVTAGGKNQPATEDAKTTAVYRQTAKASGTGALNNTQLQTAVTRMNLERQYTTLSSQLTSQSAGKKFVSEMLVGVAKEQSKKIVNDAATRQVATVMAKKTT